MKIVLIEVEERGILNIFRRAKLPRLGLPILGAILKDLGHQVVIYCEGFKPIDWDDVFSADLVGISALTPTATRAYEVVQKIRENKGEEIPIVGGGPHFTFLPKEALRYFDFVVRNEGEKTLTELVKWLENPESISVNNILGLSYRMEQKVFHNPDRPPLSPEELDALPMPDFSLIKGFRIKKMVPVSTSRGCPFSCTYCTVNRMYGQGYRFLSVERVMAVLETTHKLYPKAKVFFVDDNFFAKHGRAKQLLKAMISRHLNLNWFAQFRLSAARDPELLDLARKSGNEWGFLGVESINQATLDGWHKSQRVKDIEGQVKKIRSFGIRTLGMFMVGGDEDDTSTAKKTVKFARNKFDAVVLWISSPLPGTPYYDELDSDGRVLFKKEGVKRWRHWSGMTVVSQPKLMTPLQLQISVSGAMFNYYAWIWVKRGLEVIANLVSPLASWRTKKISFENFVLALSSLGLIVKARRSLRDHLSYLRKLVT